jgi:hypothetical protein
MELMTWKERFFNLKTSIMVTAYSEEEILSIIENNRQSENYEREKYKDERGEIFFQFESRERLFMDNIIRLYGPKAGDVARYFVNNNIGFRYDANEGCLLVSGIYGKRNRSVLFGCKRWY